MRLVKESLLVEELNRFLELLSVTSLAAVNLSMIDRPLDFRHNDFLETEVLHPFLETDDFSVGLNRIILTKLYIISSSAHLALPIPNFFQHSVSLVKYSVGMRGR